MKIRDNNFVYFDKKVILILDSQQSDFKIPNAFYVGTYLCMYLK